MVIDLPGAPMPSGTSLSQAIVRILQQYDRSLPVDFVASLVGHNSQEIMSDLKSLERHGAIKRENSTVQLTKKP
jgi:hypothetical protein